MSKQIQTYLRALKRQLWRKGLYDHDALEEMESHLLESVEAGIRLGLSVEESEKQALSRFGSAKDVSLAFEQERNPLMQNILLAVAVLAGLIFAYIDSRPTWDDTGLLVIGMILVSRLLTLLGHRRPWLIALAIGIWIPARQIFLTQDFTMLIVLLIPFIGAYGGWLVRLGYRNAFHPA